jgi:hypothetical protein
MRLESIWLASARRPAPERGTPVRTFRKLTRYAVAAAALGLAVSACSSNPNSSSSGSSNGNGGCKSASQASNVAAPPGYTVCLFVGATTAANHPDDVRVAGGNVWIAWQNSSAKDGSTTKPSTISEYTAGGKLLKSWTVIGHADGMRMDPSTGQMWVTTDEDANPRLDLISPSSSAPAAIKLPKTAWGGGLDDITFFNGSAFISASNPTLNSAGKNTAPALVKVSVTGTTATFTPVLMGDAKATTLNPPVSPVTLNLTDADSQTTDPQGDLVLMSQADDALLFIHNPGTASQTVKLLTVGTSVDDTIWPTSSNGCLLVADNNSGVFSVCSTIWVTGAPITDSPNDATVISFVGTLSMGSGQITPIITGILNPHGMAFLPR